MNRTGGRIPDIRRLVRAASSALKDAAPSREGLNHITVVFITPAYSRRLKQRFLRQNHPANVLSFRYEEEGEIFLAAAVIRAEARRTGKPYREYLAALTLHGLLHLYGYHHEGKGTVRRFQRRERFLRRVLALRGLWLGRTTTSEPRYDPA
ncbi:MAG: rRNA maturation RNase YbeY [Candidatus Sungbacteria bacterium]|uniref:Endoribonuclease YbeY n=1 Tax=Candidatus Sungiibacteriota bacterium TaxID=2750080 RepID=A0A932YV97_9BACT|nr:rRNA maturation RNase YbeY [Candidatus Sungbacteria bacterium]